MVTHDLNRLVIPGAAGDIEAALEVVEGSRCGAVVCHPHPLYGGSMYDNVVDRLCEGFTTAGISALRFNFRGVAASAGEYDRGEGETEDVRHICAWYRENYALDDICLGGYSFGAGVALRVAPLVECKTSVVVAPPLSMIENVNLADEQFMVILGDHDSIVDCHSVQEYFSDNCAVTINVLAGADHFFVGQGEQITALAAEFLGGA